MLLLVCVYGEGGGSSHHRPGLLSGVREVLLLSATLHHVSGQKQACQLVLVQMLPPLRRQLGCQTRCRRAPPPVQLLACLKRAAAGQLQPASVFPTPSCRQQKKKERREKERERERKKREREQREKETTKKVCVWNMWSFFIGQQLHIRTICWQKRQFSSLNEDPTWRLCCWGLRTSR